ncbi:hypothetical protein [Vibrio sp. 10N.239.312.D08]|uniref:hypothetical protein n=1 Tax=Vibrio sp. 10N.239.312.D08 TaxID=3229978 RepID=UPI0035504B9F
MHPTEKYSDQLVFAAEMAHRLFVNFTLMDGALDSMQRDMNADFTKGESSYMEYEFEFAQLERLKGTYLLAMDTFLTLLKKESDYPIVINDDIDYSNPYRSISGYPDWINEVFPYFQDADSTSKLMQAGHWKLINPDYNDNLAKKYQYDTELIIGKWIPICFIKVWWPIAGGFAENGYIVTDRLNDDLIMRFGREF